MKKFLVVFLTALCVICAAIALVGCEKQHTHLFDKQVVSNVYLASPATYTEKAKYYYSCECGEKGSETFDYGDMLVKDGITFNNFIVDEENCGYIKVANSVTTYSFIKEINVNGNATYSVSLDVYGLITVPTKTVSLEIGDNTFYVLQTVEDEITLYTITIRRRPIYTVTFDSDGGTEIESQSVEEDSFAVEPYLADKPAYIFDGWNYDFTEVITSDVCIRANWALDKRMAGFNFSSTATTCEILKVKDKTIISVEIPKYVTDINSQAFEGCDKLSKVYIDSLESWCTISGTGYLMRSGLKKRIFLSGKEITSLVIPEEIISIEDYAFCGCIGLTSITIPDSIKSIGDYAFAGCNKLVEVINMSNLNIVKGSKDNGYVGYSALKIKSGGASEVVNKSGYSFYTYDGINYLLGYFGDELNLQLPNEFNGETYELYYYAFSGYREIEIIKIPDFITEISERAFAYCYGLTSVSLPSVVEIGMSAFSDCYGLTSISLPSVVEIDMYAFSDCYSLTSISLPSVVEIGMSAFSDCYGLTTIILPKSLTKIGFCVFARCSNIAEVIIDKENPVYYSENNCIIEKETKILVLGCDSGIIPNDIKIIGGSAFSHCTGLTNVEIPNSVTCIMNMAFFGCRELKNVKIPKSVTKIGSYVFYDRVLINIIFEGTISEWEAVEKGEEWCRYSSIRCSDGWFM